MKKLILSASLALASVAANAQNPYLPMWEFIPDGEPYVFDDPDNPGKKRVYIYGSHDNLVTEYCGRDQVVWSAPVDDLSKWRYDGVIFTSQKNANGELLNPGGLCDVLYAPDVTVTTDANGKKTYWLYPNDQHGGRNGMVARASRPDGPFQVANWSKDNPNANDGILGFDPGVFVDDDGRVYGYWGFKHSNGAELDPKTMATVKPGTKIADGMIPGYEEDSVFRFFEASSMRKIKDKYVYIYSRWTRDGEFGLPETNYTLAYCWSNNPLGPYTYGGTIIDGRGREKQEDGSTIVTATPNGNTHGSICEINGKWWVFYHRQAGTTEYSRQAMVAPITVEVVEGPNGHVKISEAEFTSEGFMTEGLDPFKMYPAGIACYFVGPKPAYAEYPNVVYPGSHTEIHRINYDKNAYPNPYDEKINLCNMVNNVDGSVIGYKYFNFTPCKGKSVSFQIYCEPGEVDGTIDILLDESSEAKGGKKVGTMSVKASDSGLKSVALKGIKNVTGKHAVYLRISSKTPGKSICKLAKVGFVDNSSN